MPGPSATRSPRIPTEVLSYEEPLDLDELTKDLTLKKLNEIFEEVLKRANGRVDPVRSGFGQIRKEEVSVDEKIEFVSRYVMEHQRFSFRELLETAPTKTEVIVTFLAILELMKAGEIQTGAGRKLRAKSSLNPVWLPEKYCFMNNGKHHFG